MKPVVFPVVLRNQQIQQIAETPCAASSGSMLPASGGNDLYVSDIDSSGGLQAYFQTGQETACLAKPNE